MECTYCGEEVPKTKGKMLVLNNGKKHYFCSAKCEKNWSNNRNHQYREKKR